MQGENKNYLPNFSKMKLIYKRKLSVAKIRYLHINLSVLLNI